MAQIKSLDTYWLGALAEERITKADADAWLADNPPPSDWEYSKYEYAYKEMERWRWLRRLLGWLRK